MTGQPWLARHKDFVLEIVAVVVDFLLVMAVPVVIVGVDFVMPVVVFALVVVFAAAVH